MWTFVRLFKPGSVIAALLVAACSEAPPSEVSATEQGLNAAGNLDQCANGPLSAPVPCVWDAWQNGNLNQNQAHYLEGDSVPYRLRLSNLTIGPAHTVTIEWDTTETGSHALDYVTTVNRTETTADPCTDVAGCSASTFSTYAIPLDANVTKGPDGTLGNADDIAQIAGNFRLYGGTITAASGYTMSGTYSGTSQTRLTLTFTAAVGDPVLAWGGHISLRSDWRPQTTAADIPGSPFHTRFLDLDGAGGNQDRSLAAAAVYNLPTLIVIKHVINDDYRTAVAGDFTMTVTGNSPDPASSPGAESPGTIVTLAGPGAYSVGETGPTGYAATYSTDCTGTLDYDQTKTCTVTNDDTNLCAGVTCGAARDACEAAGVCNAQTGQCEYAPLPSTTVCRASAGACDVPEYCTGLTAACPADDFAAATTECRAAGGACDVAEYCTGTGALCPSDAKSTAVCRASSGICDVPESCDGVTNDCPADGYVTTGVTCRASAGVCDVAEVCTGAGPSCPSDTFVASTEICRASAGVCDVAETCTGASASCPGDSFLPGTTECRASTGVCDVAESCTGASASCPSDVFKPSTEVCRASAGECDVAETCTGSSGACPGDVFKPSTEVCRASAGVCDVAEACTGSAASCPTDAYKPSTEVCRASAGVCDVAETCTGSATDCPADAFLPSTEICRAAAGVCDVAEACTGSAASCPGDGFAAVGTSCRASTGECDPAEVCTGGAAGCPTDVAGTCTLCGTKFYDADANGEYGSEEVGIEGWRFVLTGGATSESALTGSGGQVDFTNLPEGDYTLCESASITGHWIQTAPPAPGCFTVHVPSTEASTCNLDFGNLCLGAGGGKTIGFWTNKNGQFLFMAADSGASALALLTGLNLRNADGSNFDPTSYLRFRTWLGNATATNMAYMLSAQLAAMELDVSKGLVDPTRLIYAPGTTSANVLGFATVQAVMDEANAELSLHGLTVSGPYRTYQESLKIALDRANNNLNFVQPGACSFSFGSLVTASTLTSVSVVQQ